MSSNPEKILGLLDRYLDTPVELTLYGRAALLLGFERPDPVFAMTCDVDAVFWIGQGQELLESTNFWEAVDRVNRELAVDRLFISHFFEESQVILTPGWKMDRVSISIDFFQNLNLYRLSDHDLLLSKLMRDDPQDRSDAKFICQQAGFGLNDVTGFIRQARVPEEIEIVEQFRIASEKLLKELS